MQCYNLINKYKLIKSLLIKDGEEDNNKLKLWKIKKYYKKRE